MPNPLLRRQVRDTQAARFLRLVPTYLDSPSTASLSMGAGVQMSVCCWVCLTTLGVDQQLVSKGRISGGFGTLEYALFYRGNAERFQFALSAGATGIIRQNSVTPVVGAWHFLAATYDGTSANLAIDGGVFEDSLYALDIQSAGFSFQLGAASAGDEPLDGFLDQVAIWKRALTLAETQQIYNGGRPYRYPPDMLTSMVARWDFEGSFNDTSGAGNDLANQGGTTRVSLVNRGDIHA